MEGGEWNYLGVVITGVLHIVRDDFWGNRNIVARIEEGDLFGEAFVCGGVKQIPVSITVEEDAEILLFDLGRIIGVCSSACKFHTLLIKNMISALAVRTINLMEKIEHITRHTTREKILSYLSVMAKKTKSTVIEIPFDRQELADYLSVERSALSAELGRMRDEGLLEFRKNSFTLKSAKRSAPGVTYTKGTHGY
jgi:CRP-like cAMP-binding protein